VSAINGQASKIDRSGELRSKPETLEKLWSSAKILHFADGRLAGDSALAFLTATEVDEKISSGEFASGEKYFLGIDTENNQSYFAWNSEWKTAKTDDQKKIGFTSLREIGANLAPLEIELALHAVALSNWHNSHPCCAKCGAQTKVDLGGAVRTCSKDQSQHHPRTDSAVIVLVRDSDDRILLGHQPVWPEGRFSCFAGFLEPGETFEQCVAREVFEESGVTVSQINYLGSQPWPFPASIMIAFEALVDDPKSARPDGDEITEVKWFSREELKKASADGSLLLPPAISVARKMIERWFAAKDSTVLTGGETWR
jgi:NAD+ diphosphatase